MDAFEISKILGEGSFNVIIDKGTLDSVNVILSFKL